MIMNEPQRLSRATLARLDSHTLGPLQDFAVGIVHLGVGNFQRAHQAVYTERAMIASGGDWGICGVSLRSPAVRDALAPQDGVYSVIVRRASGQSVSVVRCLRELLVAPENPQAVLRRLVDPAIRIVTLTITEKGYCRNEFGALDLAHHDIRHDLENPAAPISAIGFLAQALRQRKTQETPPFTVLCCDNLPRNGVMLQRSVVEFTAAYGTSADHDLARWIAKHVAFPCTAVDRIVPATTEADRQDSLAALGVTDAWPVATEPYLQWVIEDRFPSGRPDWERAGALMVQNVAPFEQAKLRMLNGSHSAIAYLAILAQYELVCDAMANPACRSLIDAMMAHEIAPTLTVPVDFDLVAYRHDLLERFANPALKHRCTQIATDGSQKLPLRLLGTIRERLQFGQPIPRLALAVAAWMRFLLGKDDAGQSYPIDDPLGAKLTELARAATGDAAALYQAISAGCDVIPADLAALPAFKKPVLAALEGLIRDGARHTIARAAQWS